jgi:enediyne biosynthesis protein E5
MLKLRSIKVQLILYLSGLAVFLSVKDKDIFFLAAMIIALISSLISESIIILIKKRVFEVTESSIITGLIIGFVLSSNIPWWITIVASLLAVLSKYSIRFKSKHIFNPAAFGVFMAVIIFQVSTQWRGTYLWYLLMPAGIYFVYKIRKMEIIAGYTIVFLVLYGIQAFWQKTPLWNIFGYLSYFYIFIMAIEPKTTPMKPIGKYVFGGGIAALIFIFNQLPGRLETELFSLLVMNAASLLLVRIPSSPVSLKN